MSGAHPKPTVDATLEAIKASLDEPLTPPPPLEAPEPVTPSPDSNSNMASDGPQLSPEQVAKEAAQELAERLIKPLMDQAKIQQATVQAQSQLVQQLARNMEQVTNEIMQVTTAMREAMDLTARVLTASDNQTEKLGVAVVGLLNLQSRMEQSLAVIQEAVDEAESDSQPQQ